MATTNNATAKAAGTRLQQVWASNRLTATQQRYIVSLSQYMLARKLRAKPHFEDFFTAIAAGALVQNLSDDQMTQLLNAVGMTLEKDPPADAAKFLATAAQFLDTKFLHRSRYNSLQARTKSRLGKRPLA